MSTPGAAGRRSLEDRGCEPGEGPHCREMRQEEGPHPTPCDPAGRALEGHADRAAATAGRGEHSDDRGPLQMPNLHRQGDRPGRVGGEARRLESHPQPDHSRDQHRDEPPNEHRQAISRDRTGNRVCQAQVNVLGFNRVLGGRSPTPTQVGGEHRAAAEHRARDYLRRRRPARIIKPPLAMVRAWRSSPDRARAPTAGRRRGPCRPSRQPGPSAPSHRPCYGSRTFSSRCLSLERWTGGGDRGLAIAELVVRSGSSSDIRASRTDHVRARRMPFAESNRCISEMLGHRSSIVRDKGRGAPQCRE